MELKDLKVYIRYEYIEFDCEIQLGSECVKTNTHSGIIVNNLDKFGKFQALSKKISNEVYEFLKKLKDQTPRFEAINEIEIDNKKVTTLQLNMKPFTLAYVMNSANRFFVYSNLKELIYRNQYSAYSFPDKESLDIHLSSQASHIVFNFHKNGKKD